MNTLPNQPSNALPPRSDFQSFNLPTDKTTRELAERVVGDTQEFLKNLGFTRREMAVLTSEIERSGIHRGILKAYICAEYTGIPLYRPYESFNLSFAAHSTTRKLIASIQHHHYIRRLDAHGTLHKNYPDVSPFNGKIREVLSTILPFRSRTNHESVSLLLQLPQPEWENLVKNFNPGSQLYMNAFAEVRIFHGENNQIEVLEINSRLDSLRSEELKERYRDWPHIMMRALIDYAAHSKPFHTHQAREDDERSVENPNEVKIIFPSPKQMRMRFKEEKECGYSMGSIAVYNPDTPDDTKYRMPGLSRKTSEFLYSRLPERYGFQRESIDENLAELKDEKYNNALVLRVPFIRGRVDQDPLFRLEKHSDRLRAMIKAQQDTLDIISFAVIEHQPYPIAHPIRPSPPEYLTKAAEALHAGAELAESLRFPELRMHCNSPSREAKLDELREAIPGRKIFRELVPDGFAPVSKGLGYGASDKWWQIPDCRDGEISAQFIHLKEQNRHPSLRLFVPGTNERPELIGSFSFKGAGVASIEGVRVSKPPGRRLPIYHRLDDIAEIDGKKVYKPQYSGHDLWGGQKLSGAIMEYHYAGELALFLKAVNPSLVSAAAIPISVERYLSFPSWGKDGEVQWHDPIKYIRTFLPDLSPGSGLFQAVTYSKSDVRLGQLVGKVFGMNGLRPATITETETEIVNAVRYLYFTYGAPFSQGKAELLPSGSLGINDIGRFLKALSEQNRESAEKIYSEFETRLLGALGAIHGGGGNFGGLKRNGAGLMFGGPQTIRNIDLSGTMHDYETAPYLPWVPASASSEVKVIQEESERTFLQGADALLCKESLYWMRKILFGFDSSLVVTTEKLKIDRKQDITVLTSRDRESLLLRRSFIDLMAGSDAEKILRHEPMLEKYRQSAARGREVADELIENPW